MDIRETIYADIEEKVAKELTEQLNYCFSEGEESGKSNEIYRTQFYSTYHWSQSKIVDYALKKLLTIPELKEALSLLELKRQGRIIIKGMARE